MKIILLSVLLYSTCGFAQSTTAGVLKNSLLDKTKPGVTIDFSDKTKPGVPIKMYCGSRRRLDNPPLFILNGFVIADSVFSKIDPFQINSIQVSKDSIATERFGTKGKNGVIIINAKQQLVADLTKQGFLKPIL